MKPEENSNKVKTAKSLLEALEGAREKHAYFACQATKQPSKAVETLIRQDGAILGGALAVPPAAALAVMLPLPLPVKEAAAVTVISLGAGAGMSVADHAIEERNKKCGIAQEVPKDKSSTNNSANSQPEEEEKQKNVALKKEAEKNKVESGSKVAGTSSKQITQKLSPAIHHSTISAHPKLGLSHAPVVHKPAVQSTIARPSAKVVPSSAPKLNAAPHNTGTFKPRQTGIGDFRIHDRPPAFGRIVGRSRL